MRYIKQINKFFIQAWHFKKIRSKVGSVAFPNWPIEGHTQRTTFNRARFIRTLVILL